MRTPDYSLLVDAIDAEDELLRDLWRRSREGHAACPEGCGAHLALSVAEGRCYRLFCTGCGWRTGFFQLETLDARPRFDTLAPPRDTPADEL